MIWQPHAARWEEHCDSLCWGCPRTWQQCDPSSGSGISLAAHPTSVSVAHGGCAPILRDQLGPFLAAWLMAQLFIITFRCSDVLLPISLVHILHAFARDSIDNFWYFSPQRAVGWKWLSWRHWDWESASCHCPPGSYMREHRTHPALCTALLCFKPGTGTGSIFAGVLKGSAC